ncbi:multifunctional aminopeptidase A [Candidatus Mycoplasma haematolamae str. Purdue]|uniref:Probable cytosol aminopeptidase n=1 Tax=Mycoplasma haematolamae (strain Purdue) TaxID=1212765 RepID=I7C7B4_MYCHA|nr:leucyl aminopeptidase family protein [Candidatus Mycoplasma haematolamae]AFO52432.1 multifunctional aminopeptidase A [Candidatus Mycoplasma haematolamae str. Purdue]
MRDTRAFKLSAIKGDNHLKIDINYSAATANISIDPSKLVPSEFLSSMKKCLGYALNWEVDFPSFTKIGGLESYEYELYLKSLIERLMRKPVCFHEKPDNKDIPCIKLVGLDKPSLEASYIVEGETRAKNWAEMPPNILGSTQFVKEVSELAKELNLSCEVLTWEDLKKKGFELSCAVGQNKRNSYLVVLRESQVDSILKKKERKKVALIGKGICFDTGGLSIKTGNYMRGMKFDMSGSALVASIFFALSKAGFSEEKELIALLPVSENLVGSESIKVDSVLRSYSGKSVEITNTDAEGRLVLAEAMTYAAKDLGASELITIATLTGAIKYALGSKYSGAWTTLESQWKELSEAAEYAGEHLWRMPLDEYYLEELRSNIADLKNSAATGAGGSSRAATFLSEFREGKDYIHLDIANTSNTEGKNQVGLAPLFKTLYFYIKGVKKD